MRVVRCYRDRMRSIGALGLLGVCACSTPNQLFGIMTEDAGSSSSDAGGSTAASPTTGVATTPTTSSEGGSTAAVAEASTHADPDTGASATAETTTPPGTDSGGETDSGETQSTVDPDSGGPMWLCEPTIHPIANNVALVLGTNTPWQGCVKQGPFQSLNGYGKMENGSLLFVSGQCSNMDDGNFSIEYGSAYPVADRDFCGKLRIVWDPAPGCKIAALTLEEFDANNQSKGFLYGLYHSPATLPEGFPLAPTIVKQGSCGCPEEGEEDCCDPQPGQHALKVGEKEIPAGESMDIGGVKFYNWNAYVPPSCITDPNYAPRIDWFSAAL